MSQPHYRGPPMHRGAHRGASQADETAMSLMEMENNQRWSELGEQVDLLKNLSLDINSEVNSQNKLLDSMGRTFSSTSDMFKSTMSKLGLMLNSSSSKHMYYLIVFVVVVFLLVYFMMGRKQ